MGLCVFLFGCLCTTTRAGAVHGDTVNSASRGRVGVTRREFPDKFFRRLISFVRARTLSSVAENWL